MNSQEDGIGVMGKQSKCFKMPIDVEFQADDYYGTDIDEVIIGIIKRKIHDIDEDLETAIKSSMNAIKLWTSLVSLFEVALFADQHTLVESKSCINSNNDLLIDKHEVYNSYLNDTMSNVILTFSDQDDKEMLWYIYRHFESIISSAKTELENGIGKTSQYTGTLNHVSRVFNYLVSKITPVFVLLMMRYGPDEEFDKKTTAFISGKITDDELCHMSIPVESCVIKGMSNEYIFLFSKKRYFGGLDDWKKMLGKYGKYNKAFQDYYRSFNRKRKK